MESISEIEHSISKILVNLMPSVKNVRLNILTQDVKQIFSKGVELKIDDGIETDVLLKGQGLQRCIVFSLLQALILNEKKILVSESDELEISDPIILAIEEPEVYIHPQIGKLFYDVLETFSKGDQVVYTTHSPRFIDVYKYDSIAIISKSIDGGTAILNCNIKAFEGLSDKKIFKGLTQLNSDVNELFFAKKVIVVEGPQDEIAIVEASKKLGIITNIIEEKNITVVVAGGKESIPFFVRVLNAFYIDYVVLHDLDIKDDMNIDAKKTEEKRNADITDLANEKIVTFPIALEYTLRLENHLKDQYEALKYFQNEKNINNDLTNIVKQIYNKLGIEM